MGEKEKSREWFFDSQQRFYFLGERYIYSIADRSLQKIPKISECIDKRSPYVNQEDLEKIANESFAEVKSFLDDTSNRTFLESYTPVVLYELNDLIIKSSKELDKRLLIYSQKLEQTANLFEGAYRVLGEIIEKNNISKKDPEKAILEALDIAKKEGKPIKLQYEDVKKLACNLVKAVDAEAK